MPFEKRTHTGFAPGKLILTGEHSVVYGYPAIAIPVNLGVTVTLSSTHGGSYFRTPDARLESILLPFLPTSGVAVSIHSTLPMGKGMGSSAALSVALVRALASWEGKTSDFSTEYEIGMSIEKQFHGNPSGVDHTVSALGKMVFYTKKASGPEITPMQNPPLELLVVDSGEMGNTATMVEHVAKQYKESPETTKEILKNIGDITQTIHEKLLCPILDLPSLGACFTQNHEQLRNLGLSTPAIESIITYISTHGGYGAKLSGSGGGGVVMALIDSPAQHVPTLAEMGYTAYVIHPFVPTA